MVLQGRPQSSGPNNARALAYAETVLNMEMEPLSLVVEDFRFVATLH
jgi:hypothetical protein